MAISRTMAGTLQGFIVNATSANAMDCEDVLPANTVYAFEVKHITINVMAAMTVTIGQNETANAVTTALIGPVSMGANTTLQWDFNPSMTVDRNSSLTVDTSASGNILVFAQGKYVS
jgi:hypothetical protein